MNTAKYKVLIFTLISIGIFVLSACGTLTIEKEPDLDEPLPDMTQSDVDPSETGGMEPPPTLSVERENDAVTEVAADGPAVAEGNAASEETADQSAALQSYSNSDYGFSLEYPLNWSLVEANDADFAGPGSRSVQLSQGTVTLVIGYRRVGEQAAIGGSGAPAGDIESRGTIQAASQEVERNVLVYEGKDKAVIYGQPGTPVSAGGLEFAMRLDDLAQVAYEDVELPRSIQAEADAILSSLTVVMAGGDDDEIMSAADYDYSGWQHYSNETLGYSLMYPGQVDIMGANRDGAVEFVGPIVGDDHWPWFSVHHLGSGFFRPPAGTDVRQWLADNNIPGEPVDHEMMIGGLPAVHYAFAASPQAYGRDEYYVIHGEQLFKITILHAGGNEDWALYEQFLASINFVEGR